MNMNIDELTVGQIKQIGAMLNINPSSSVCPYQIGENYFIRTVTHIDTGTLVSVGDKELVLENAAWIADTGRYADAFRTGELNEVEPYPDGAQVVIGRGAIIDAAIWPHPLPREQK